MFGIACIYVQVALSIHLSYEPHMKMLLFAKGCPFISLMIMLIYAVVVCDSSATANHLYMTLDSTEFLKTANVFDLQFIRDSMEFKRAARDVATEVPYFDRLYLHPYLLVGILNCLHLPASKFLFSVADDSIMFLSISLFKVMMLFGHKLPFTCAKRDLFSLYLLDFMQAPPSYKEPDSETPALQPSKVKLTWDDDEPDRKILRWKSKEDQVSSFCLLT